MVIRLPAADRSARRVLGVGGSLPASTFFPAALVRQEEVLSNKRPWLRPVPLCARDRSTGRRQGNSMLCPRDVAGGCIQVAGVAGKLSLVAGSRDARRLRRAIYAESRADPAGCCGDVSSRARWSTLTSPSRQKTSGPQS